MSAGRQRAGRSGWDLARRRTDARAVASDDSAGWFDRDRTKTLVCDDGSGSFTIEVNAATVFGTPNDQGGWAVLGGTDDYATLSGGGNLVGTYVPDGIIDLYTGVVRT